MTQPGHLGPMIKQGLEVQERLHAQKSRDRLEQLTADANRAAWWRWAGTTVVAVVALGLSILSLARPARGRTVVLVPAASVPAPSAPTTLPSAPTTLPPAPVQPGR